MAIQETVSYLADTLLEMFKGEDRRIVALAGPPGVGKSTLSDALVVELKKRGKAAAIVPMDGFHLDNAVLEAQGTLARKGAPFTFDVHGYIALLKRLACDDGRDIAVPVFDRSLDLSRAGGRLVTRAERLLIAEGNYLLLDQPPWSEMAHLFDYTLMLRANGEELRRRLIERWLGHGLDREAARARALSNDIPNAEFVLNHSRKPDLEIATDTA